MKLNVVLSETNKMDLELWASPLELKSTLGSPEWVGPNLKRTNLVFIITTPSVPRYKMF